MVKRTQSRKCGVTMALEEIKIGDEVIHNTEKYVVTGISNGSYFCLRADGKFLCEYFKSVLEKTGKHFNSIVAVLNQLDNHYDEFGFVDPFSFKENGEQNG